MTIDETQLYVTGILYKGDAFPSDPKVLFGIIDNAIRNNITNLTYSSSCINRSENRFSNSTTREQLLFFIKDIVYAGNAYLSDTDSASLRTAMINVFNNITDLTYTDVEVRSTRVTV